LTIDTKQTFSHKNFTERDEILNGIYFQHMPEVLLFVSF